MPTFDWAESPGATCEYRPTVVTTQFGDGYRQDSPAGLNHVAEIWDVPLLAVTAAAAGEIDAAVKPGLGYTRWTWTPPGRTAPLKFICTAYARTLGQEWGTFDIRLRFEQVFEP